MTHAASAPISQTGRLSPAALAFAVVLHVLVVVGLLWLTPFRPFKAAEDVIEVTVDRGGVPPMEEPSPPPQPPAPPQTLAMPQPPEPPPEAKPEPPRPPIEQAVPPPEPPPPPLTAMDFPKPVPPPPPPAPPTPPRPQAAPPQPPQQQRPPADNRAAAPQPSPLRGPTDIIFGPTSPTQNDYFTKLARQLAANRYYPQSARDRHQEGRVVMRVTIARDGRLLDARVERSSGVPVIDAAELDTIRKSAPFPPLPIHLGGDSATFLLPVTYELR